MRLPEARFHELSSRRFSVGYDRAATLVSSSTRSESSLLVGSMIRANTTAKNTSSALARRMQTPDPHTRPQTPIRWPDRTCRFPRGANQRDEGIGGLGALGALGALGRRLPRQARCRRGVRTTRSVRHSYRDREESWESHSHPRRLSGAV